jgi:LacI family transcriptional regulator
MPATSRDVAREAGVSIATVSRVLNNSGPVKEATRQRVREAARQLRFMPNTTARNLSTRTTGTIGVLLPDLHGEFFSELIRGIDQVAQRRGYHLLVSSAHNQAHELESAVHAMRGRVDGLILLASGLAATTLEHTLPDHLPVGLMNAATDRTRYDVVNIDNCGGARAMTEHLLQLGHREVRMIAGADANRDALERIRGFHMALDAARIPRRGNWVVPGDFSEAGGAHAAQRLLEEQVRPSAIFAANDSMAVGALSAVRAAGLSVPADIAVVGFDDIPIAAFMDPPLTTVRVSIARVSELLTERLFTSIRAGNANPHTQETVATELVVRRSCGASLR